MLLSSEKHDQYLMKKVEEFEQLLESESNLPASLAHRRLISSEYGMHNSFVDPSRLRQRMKERDIPANCAEILENGLYCYMERVIWELYSTFQVLFL